MKKILTFEREKYAQIEKEWNSVFRQYLNHLDSGRVNFFQECRGLQIGQLSTGFVPPKRGRCATIFRYRYSISVFSLKNRVVRIRYTGLRFHQIFLNYQSDGVYTVSRKNGSVHRSLHRTWFSSWSWIYVFSMNLYKGILNGFERNDCQGTSVSGRVQTGVKGVVPPVWNSHDVLLYSGNVLPFFRESIALRAPWNFSNWLVDFQKLIIHLKFKTVEVYWLFRDNIKRVWIQIGYSSNRNFPFYTIRNSPKVPRLVTNYIRGW